MSNNLDMADIQGNILEDFVRNYQIARFIFLQVTDAAAGRQFVLEYCAKVTTALRWGKSDTYIGKSLAAKPQVAINIGFTYGGFLKLELPTRTLAKMPPEFMDGMKLRAEILGDDFGKNVSSNWDEVWKHEEQAHILIGLNALLDPKTGAAVPELETETQYLQELCAAHKLTIMTGHRNPNPAWQDAAAILIQNQATYKPVPLEHFGFVDGISNPVFEGQFGEPHVDDLMAVGNGKLLETGEWAPLATGEFLLGHPDEAQETANTTAPPEIMRNGTFMVYRKLHENVTIFESYIDRMAQDYAAQKTIPAEEARETIMAKMVGRWKDGVPLAVAPNYAAWKIFNEAYKDTPPAELNTLLVDFRYGHDPEGIACPVTSHTRRTNMRDGIVPGAASSALNNRRRILRRGIPYGSSQTPDEKADDREHGIIFLAMCTSLTRQFEFVQQQWLNYGLDANAGNDTCPVLGNRAGDPKFLIPVDPAGGDAPFICSDIPQFVEVRGGDYFFLPSMTALRMIGMGIVDPT